MNQSFRRLLTPWLLLAATAAAAPAWATPYSIDRFWGERSGLAFFNDDFNDNVAPPTGGTFITSTAALYSSVTGNFTGAELGGKLTLDPVARGVQTVNPFTLRSEGVYFTAAYLGVNVDPTVTTLGLKLNHTYAIHALIDLSRPLNDFGNVGLRLADYDNSGPDGWNDIIDFEVGRNTSTGALSAFFIRRDLRVQINTLISSTALNTALGDQIEISLLKETADSPAITAAYRYVNSGVPVGALQRVGITDAYHGEVFTRPGIFAFQAVPLPGTLGLALVGLITLTARQKYQSTSTNSLLANNILRPL
jgi:hypothetical protein